MSNNPNERAFKPLNIAIMTVSDSRTESNDTSGDTLVKLLTGAGHTLVEKRIVPDDIYQIRSVATGRDSTPEAVKVLLDKEIEGFGEVFRAVSYEEIGTSTIASRALSGVANATYIFCLPGSTGACRTGWGKLISHQLDYRTRPCNLVELMPRVLEKG